MKRDAALAALNSNYRAIESGAPFNVSWGCYEETGPHVKVSVAEVARSQKMD